MNEFLNETYPEKSVQEIIFFNSKIRKLCWNFFLYRNDEILLDRRELPSFN